MDAQPHTKEPTPEELQKLKNLKQTIAQAVSVGSIDSHEIEAIKRDLSRSKGKSEHLYRELELYDPLLIQKLQTDELEFGTKAVNNV